MKITKGPMLERFAKYRDIPIDEVVAWVNSYVNEPHLFPHAEETEQERLASIRAYIEMRLSESINERIRASIREAA